MGGRTGRRLVRPQAFAWQSGVVPAVRQTLVADATAEQRAAHWLGARQDRNCLGLGPAIPPPRPQPLAADVKIPERQLNNLAAANLLSKGASRRRRCAPKGALEWS